MSDSPKQNFDEGRRKFFKTLVGGTALAAGAVIGIPSMRASATSILGNTTSPAPAGINCEGNFFPLLLTNAGLSPESIDEDWMQFLQRLRTEMVRFQVDFEVYQKYFSRYQKAFGMVRQQGLPIHIVNCNNIVGYNGVIGVREDFQQYPPKYQNFAEYNTAAVGAYLHARPDTISVMTEPGGLNSRLSADFTPSQYADVISGLTAMVKRLSPGTQTCVKLLYNSSFDNKVLALCLEDPHLDGVALDIYGIGDSMKFYQSEATDIARAVRLAGKKVGVGETWREPLLYEPNTDSTSNEPAEAAWIVNMADWASSAGAGSYFLPFYDTKFISSAVLPKHPSHAEGVLMWESIEQLLERELAGNVTFEPTYFAYQGVSAVT